MLKPIDIHGNLDLQYPYNNKITLIVAYEYSRRGIGLDNKIPWYYKKDLQYFKSVTEHGIVVMGNNTFKSILDSLKKPLPNRHSIVLTRSVNTNTVDFNKQVNYIRDFRSVLQIDKELFIIGGHAIYKIFIPYASKLHVTYIPNQHQCDTYFPTWPIDDYICTYSQNVLDNAQHYTFLVYEKKISASTRHLPVL